MTDNQKNEPDSISAEEPAYPPSAVITVPAGGLIFADPSGRILALLKQEGDGSVSFDVFNALGNPVASLNSATNQGGAITVASCDGQGTAHVFPASEDMNTCFMSRHGAGYKAAQMVEPEAEDTAQADTMRDWLLGQPLGVLH